MPVPNWLGGPTDLPGALDEARTRLQRIEELLRAILEVVSVSNEPAAPPDLIDLGPGTIAHSHVRYRTIGLIFTGGTSTDLFVLRAGNRPILTFYPPSGGYLPFVQTLERGSDLQIVDLTTANATNWYAELVAGVE